MVDDFERVVFVPVIHTDKESVDQVCKVVSATRPDVVAVELDHDRYKQLLDNDDQKSERPSVTGDVAQDLLQQFAQLENALGDVTGSEAGEEMMAAIEEGRKIGAKVALVDRPLKETMRQMMQIPVDELYRLSSMMPDAAADIADGGAGKLFLMLKEEGAIEELLEQFRAEFPNLTRILIEERDRYIAKALHFILGDVDGRIVAVLGAGHIQGVKRALRDLLASDAS
ncbi:MAG: TraB domain-containing protein [Candidatus Thorarchaeota archaeon]|nr:MAG: hypothetical protein DRP09_02595 [Candidatus Thorarchaeota archaeon]RLI60029.1 MAG: hypothetical protein DRO87_01065 [Candidatus Thorarchaeota archaeon]